jgi:flagellar protein FlaG
MLPPICTGEVKIMFEQETLTRVSEYKPNPKVARVAPALVTLSPNVEAEDSAAKRPQEMQAMDAKALDKALGNLSAHVQNLQRSLQFSVDKDSGETVVRIIDTETNEVIRQIPSEELLAIEERLRETAGVLVSEQV